MKFESTKKLFFKAGESFQDKLEEMLISPNCIHFSLKLGDYPCFFYYGIPVFELLCKVQTANQEAIHAFTNLPGVAQSQYLRNSLVEEIKQTNEIEGVFSSRREIFELLNDLGKRKKRKIGSIVSKYSLLLEGKEKRVTTCNAIRTIYDEMFFSGDEPLIDPDDAPDGVLFRKNFVGIYGDSDDEPIHKGLTPEDKIVEAIDEGLSIINSDDLNIFLRIALFHFIFEYAHPFYDGNGRVGRFLASLSLIEECHNPIAGFLLSKEIKKNKAKYYKLFSETEDVRNRGDLSLFVYGFLEILLSLFNKCKDYAERRNNELASLYAFWKDRQPGLSKNEDGVLYVLCQATLFSDFGIELTEIAKTKGVSEKTVFRVLDSLSKRGMISKSKFGRKLFYRLVEKEGVNQ